MPPKDMAGMNVVTQPSWCGLQGTPCKKSGCAQQQQWQSSLWLGADGQGPAAIKRAVICRVQAMHGHAWYL
jgi:hypothetical protein